MKKIIFISLFTAAILSTKHGSAQILIPGFNASDQNVPLPFPGYDPDDPLGLRKIKPVEPYPFGGTVPSTFLPPDFPDPGPAPDNTPNPMDNLNKIINEQMHPPVNIDNIPGKDNSPIGLPSFTNSRENLNSQPTQPNSTVPVNGAPAIKPIIPPSHIIVLVSISIF